MAILEVLTYPDSRLKSVSQEAEISSSKTVEIVDNLIDTMQASPGCIGIAAPQCNIHKRIIVVDVSRNERLNSKLGLLVLINPVIERHSGKSVAREGCLSLPDLIATVRRPKKLVVNGFNQEGRSVTIEASGFDARAIHHEIDHLDGILFLDRVSSLKTDVFRRGRHLS